jgi:hypothetical protein
MAAPDPPEIKPITVVTPMRRLWSWWLWLSWPPADRGLWIKRPILRLSFIHVAHWGQIDRLPAAASRLRAAPLPTPYVIFQSNFDGPAREYAEAFSFEMPWRIRGLWGGAYGFPGPRPSNRFVDYVLSHAAEEPYHYYSRYPAATVRTVRAARELDAAFAQFRRRAKGLDPHAFAKAWQEFLTREQHNL